MQAKCPADSSRRFKTVSKPIKNPLGATRKPWGASKQPKDPLQALGMPRGRLQGSANEARGAPKQTRRTPTQRHQRTTWAPRKPQEVVRTLAQNLHWHPVALDIASALNPFGSGT